MTTYSFTKASFAEYIGLNNHNSNVGSDVVTGRATLTKYIEGEYLEPSKIFRFSRLGVLGEGGGLALHPWRITRIGIVWKNACNCIYNTSLVLSPSMGFLPSVILRRTYMYVELLHVAWCFGLYTYVSSYPRLFWTGSFLILSCTHTHETLYIYVCTYVRMYVCTYFKCVYCICDRSLLRRWSNMNTKALLCNDPNSKCGHTANMFVYNTFKYLQEIILT